MYTQKILDTIKFYYQINFAVHNKNIIKLHYMLFNILYNAILYNNFVKLCIDRRLIII